MYLEFKGSGFPDISDEDIKEIADIMMKEFYELLTNNIRSNSFGYALTPSTLLSRHYKGSGSIPLVNSGLYLKSITMKDGAVFIADGIHAGSTITFAELSEILEYGRYDKHFSGFPHWRPTIEQFRPRAEKILLNFLSKKV